MGCKANGFLFSLHKPHKIWYLLTTFPGIPKMSKTFKFTIIAILAFAAGGITFTYLRPAKVETRVIRVGKASWYSQRSPGIKARTANNEIFNDREMTCALWGAPFNQKIKITNLENGKSVVVRVNDRGPHKRYVRKGRIIDLTKNAFDKIASLKKGLIDVQIEFL